MRRHLIDLALHSRKFVNWRPQRPPVYFDDIDSGPVLEKHFSPSELAKIWGLSVDTIREMFGKEKGVLKHTVNQKGKRRYVTLRIPQSVVVRLHNRLSA